MGRCRIIRAVFVIVFFLLISGRTVADGPPGEYLLSDRWRQLFTVCSPLDNPALIMEEPYRTFRGVLAFSSGDPARLFEMGAVQPLGLYSTAAITLAGENGGTVRNARIIGDSIVSGGSFSNNNLFFIGSYALNPFNKLSIGVNANIAYQGNFGAPGWGFGFDAGISYRLLYDPYFGHHIIGIAYKNLFSPFGNGKISMPYSSQIKMQYHVSFFRNRFNFDYQIAFNDLNSKNSFFVNGSKKIDWDMGFQIGAEVIKNLRITAIADLNQETKLSSFGLVAGMDLQKLKNSRNLSFSYQYLQNLKTDLIGMHSLYTAARMGIHREQIFARNMAHKAQYIISDMYTKAMQQYFSGQYWESYFNFSRLLIDNPEFFKNDAVAFYAASCLEKLDMRQQALRCYQELKKQFTESSYISLADLGMMRILYREGRFADVEKKFTDILADSSVVDSIKQYATYYMGETELLQGNYGAASEYLSQIEQDHSLYGFAQHSMATVAEFLGKDKDSIRQYLFNVVESAQVNNPAQKEILNRSLVLLGYLYYEENLMSKAVVALRMV